ncbi:MAG: hypothetical protein AB1Z98_29100 [Nannocystaceae bacterium]
MQDRGSARRSMTTGLPWGLAAVLTAAPALAAGPADGATEDDPPAEVASDSTEPEPTEADSTGADSTDAETEPVDAPSPPRIDGVYLGGTVFGGIGILRVNDLVTGTPFATFGGTITVGQMVFPWLGLGLHGGGGGGVRSEEGARQTLGQGYVGMDFKFVPAPQRLPLSLRASFGFGGGAVRQEGITNRSGFGGAQFGAGIRYELFPFAKRFRPYRGGGLGLGPELGWIGFTPAAAGRPMSNVIYLALSTTFYFGS